jgi:hypothetical protein
MTEVVYTFRDVIHCPLVIREYDEMLLQRATLDQ